MTRLRIAVLCMLAACERDQGAVRGVQRFDGVARLIQDSMRVGRVPSVVVAVARGDSVLWEQGFGMADPVRHVPATPSTMYQTASVTKLFTGTALMVLHERGQLDLDRSVNAYLGEEHVTSPAWNVTEATVERVATHTGGFATYDDLCASPAPTCQEEMIRRYGIVIWRPGERFDYSNLGFGILSEVVRHVAHESFAGFLHDSVLGPLGLADCAVRTSTTLSPQMAVPYDPHLGRTEHPPLRASEGASGLWCSAHDLLRFGMFQVGTYTPQAHVLSDSSIAALRTSTVPADEGMRYGFGWWHEHRFDEDLVYVAGGTSQATALLYTVPAERIVVVVVCNTGILFAPSVVDEVLATLVPRYRAARNRAAHAAGTSAESRAPTPAMAQALASLAGIWRGGIVTDGGTRDLTLSVSDSGAVAVTLAGAPPTALADARDQDGELAGTFAGDLRLNVEPRRYRLRLVVIRRGARLLNGGVWTQPLPGSDEGPLHTYWVEVERQGRGTATARTATAQRQGR